MGHSTSPAADGRAAELQHRGAAEFPWVSGGQPSPPVDGRWLRDRESKTMRPFTRLAGVALLCAVAAAGQSATAPAQADGAFGTDRNYCGHSALSQVPSTSKPNLPGSAAGAAAGRPARQQDGKRQRLALQANADAGLSRAEQRALPHLHHPGGGHRAAATLRGRRLSAAERHLNAGRAPSRTGVPPAPGRD